MTTFEFKIGHDQTNPADVLLSLLSGKAPPPSRLCSCDECTAERINAAGQRKPISDADMVETAKRTLLKSLEHAKKLSESCASANALIIENPTRPEFDHAMLLQRVEAFNSVARCVQTLAGMLPESVLDAELRAQLPNLVSWEKALDMLEKDRARILEIARAQKNAEASEQDFGRAAARIVGHEIAKVIKDATRGEGRTEEELKAIIEAATERAKSAICEAAERTPTYPSPPPTEQAAS
jgi:hypothetical protein